MRNSEIVIARTLSCLRKGIVVSAANCTAMVFIFAQISDDWPFLAVFAAIFVPLAGIFVIAPIVEIFFRDTPDNILLSTTLFGTIAGASVGLLIGGDRNAFAHALFGFLGSLVALFVSQRNALTNDPSRNRQAWSARIVVLMLACGAAIHMEQRRSARAYLLDVLSLKALPATIADTKCHVDSFTDLMVDCIATVNPREFTMLLANRDFKSHPCYVRNHKENQNRLISASFEPAECYRANPREFTHGGWVEVMADRTRQHVLTQMYVE